MLRIFRWFSGRPLWLLHGVGALLGWITYAASPAYRQRFDANAAQAGVPKALARGAVAAAGRMVGELPFLWMRPMAPSLPMQVTWRGADLVTAALAAKRGLVLFTPHLGSFEITALAFALRPGFGPITVLYRPARKASLRRVTEASRARPNLSTAPATLAGVRQMIRALRRGETVGLLPDQVPPDGMGVWAPFFGRPAYTMTLAARLVSQTGATPLLIWGERLPRGRGYTVHVSALPEPLPADDTGQAESAAVINRAMEHLILQRPDQYLWGYNRYKTPRSAEPPP